MSSGRPRGVAWGPLYLRLTTVVLGTLSFFGVTVFILHTLALGRATLPLRLEMIRAAADEAVRDPRAAAARRAAGSPVQVVLLGPDGALLAGRPLPRWVRREMRDRKAGEYCSKWIGPCFALRPILLAGTSAGSGTLVVYYRVLGSFLAPFTVAFLAGVVLWLLVSAAAGVVLLSALRRADEARGRLLAGLAHDLGTPLTSIRGFAETRLARKDSESDAEVSHEWTVVYREALRMQRLVEDMLAVSRLEAGRLGLVRRPYDLRESVEAAAERATLAYGRPPALDVPKEPVVYSADRDRIDQVLGNLVDNAYRHGGGDVEIVLRQDPGGVSVVILDHGNGLSPAVRERLFRRYSRGETSAGGSGLGLAVAREIAVRHGGQLVLEDAAGGGCQARLTLPTRV